MKEPDGFAEFVGSRVDRREAYVRRVLATTFIALGRRRWSFEYSTRDLPDQPATDDQHAQADTRIAVMQALRKLPPRQRATLVLRFFEDLSEANTAAALGCSVGTGKKQTFRALAALRVMPGLEHVATQEMT